MLSKLRVGCLVIAAACTKREAPPPPSLPPPASEAGAASETVLQPLREARCVFKEKYSPLPVRLRFHGRQFAIIEDGREIDLRLGEGAGGGTATVDAQDIVLTGEVRLADTQLHRRTFDGFHEGWLAVHFVRPKRVAGETLTVEPKLPSTVRARTPPVVSRACADFSATRPMATKDLGELVFLAPGRSTALHASELDGPIVADVDVPADADWTTREAFVLSRKGKAVNIRIEGPAVAEGWIDASAIGPRPPVEHGSNIGEGRRRGRAAPPLFCPREVAVLVRDGATVVRVGTVKAGAVLPRAAPPTPAPAPDEVPLDLGADEERDALIPFTRKASLEGCQPTPAP